MTERIARLRAESVETAPCLSIERGVLVTRFYRENLGRWPAPVLRGRLFHYLCEHKSIHLGPDELIVGERGPSPRAVPTYPELTCHSAEDLRILDSRPMTSYRVDPADIARYEEEVIPWWRGRSIRDRAFEQVPPAWQALYEAGLFTEFMEQRAPGHTALDDTIYHFGLRDRQRRIEQARAGLDFLNDPEAASKQAQLEGMHIACEGAILFALRHAELAERQAAETGDPVRKAELERIAEVCRRVPAEAPRDFHEALQMYWFVHLGTITELNGWDAMSPGHLDRHLAPFYERGLAEGTLDREQARELLSCFWIKVNNTPAPPKVGVTAAESGTYNDFTQINLGGLTREGGDASCEVSYLILEVLNELQLLQPQVSVHISEHTPDALLEAAGRVIRRGSGYPSVFNSDLVTAQQVRMGKSLEDAREGGTSGCIETGCFGKEAYILHGYLNVPKILELALNDGCDPRGGRRLGPATGEARSLAGFDDLYAAFERQLHYVVDSKIAFDNHLQRLYAGNVPAPFLSSVIADCIEMGRDYYDGGPRYNTDYIQCVGLGTVTDSLSALRHHVYDENTVKMDRLLAALQNDWAGEESLRQRLFNHTPFYGNDDDRADAIMQRVYESLLKAIEGKPSPKGATYHLNLLSTTCHVYFGKMLGATPNGRRAGAPVSDGTSPSHGADRRGPTAVVKSLAKIDQVTSGGTLLNQRFLPQLLAGEPGLAALAALIRTYFRLGGHHMQFNVIDTETLRDAQARPEAYRNLLVRVAGYSDYFVDLDIHHQEEIIARTAQPGWS